MNIAIVSNSPNQVLARNLLVTTLFVGLMLVGCGPAPEAPEALGPVRTPQPTFTPTPNVAAEEAVIAAEAEPTVDPDAPVTATISGALLNVRSGPGVQFDIVAETNEGDIFEVVGVDESGDWWNICCVGEGEGGSGWVIGEFIEIEGPIERFGVTSTQGRAQANSSQTGGPVASDTSDAANSAGSEAASAVVDENAPIAVINAPVVNARSGPNTTFDIVAELERGREFSIVGSNATREWWQLCCVDGQEVWVIDDYVDTQGDLDRLDNSSSKSDGADSAQASDQAVAAAATGGLANFTLTDAERFTEPGVVRIYLYVLDGGGALADYSLRVTRNGETLTVDETSFGGQPGFTWPVADARQRFQNMKVEFPGVEPAGVWEVQLINAEGEPVGPAATFELGDKDGQRELYVRYDQL